MPSRVFAPEFQITPEQLSDLKIDDAVIHALHGEMRVYKAGPRPLLVPVNGSRAPAAYSVTRLALLEPVKA